MVLSRFWLIIPLLAILSGGFHPLWLMHDIQEWRGGWLDDFLHACSGNGRVPFFSYLVGVLGLLFLLAQAIAHKPSRALWLTLIWCGIGLGLAALAGSHLDVLQSTYNDWMSRRITPDDYLSLVREEFVDDPYTVSVFGPHDAPIYTWATMISLENKALCLISSTAAASIFLLRRRPWHAVWVTPLAMLLPLAAYFAVAPWTMVLAWDEFIGDRILGAAAFGLFLSGGWDESGATAVYVYVLSMALFATIWTLQDQRRSPGAPNS